MECLTEYGLEALDFHRVVGNALGCGFDVLYVAVHVVLMPLSLLLVCNALVRMLKNSPTMRFPRLEAPTVWLLGVYLLTLLAPWLWAEARPALFALFHILTWPMVLMWMCLGTIVLGFINMLRDKHYEILVPSIILVGYLFSLYLYFAFAGLGLVFEAKN